MSNTFKEFILEHLAPKVPARVSRKILPENLTWKMVKKDRSLWTQSWGFFSPKPKRAYHYAEKAVAEGGPLCRKLLAERLAEIRGTKWISASAYKRAVATAVHGAAHQVRNRLLYHAPRSTMNHPQGINAKYGPLKDSIRVEKASRYREYLPTASDSNLASVVVAHAFYSADVNRGIGGKILGTIKVRLSYSQRKGVLAARKAKRLAARQSAREFYAGQKRGIAARGVG